MNKTVFLVFAVLAHLPVFAGEADVLNVDF